MRSALIAACALAPLQQAAEESAAAPQVFGQHTGAVTAVAFVDGAQRVVTGSAAGELRLWTARGKLVGAHDWPRGIALLCPVDDGRTISFVAERDLGLFEGKKGKFRGNVQMRAGGRCIAFVPRFRWVFVGFEDGALARYESGTAVAEHDLYGTGAGAFTCLAAGAEGERLFAGTQGGELLLVDPRELEVTARWRPAEARVVDVAFAHGGERVLAADADGAVRLFDPAVPREVLAVEHGAAVTCAAFGPRGEVFLSADAAGTVRIWSAESGAPLALLRAADEGPLRDLAVAPKGDVVLAAGPGAAVTRWELDLRRLGRK